MDAFATLFVDNEDKTELMVHDVRALIDDLRLRLEATGPDAAVEHRVTVLASETPTIAARGHQGVLRIRRDVEQNLIFVAVVIDGGGSFEFGFRDVDPVLQQLRRVPAPGPRLLRDVMRDLFDGRRSTEPLEENRNRRR